MALGLSVFFITSKVQAASLYPAPAKGDYKVGQTFSVNISVSSSDQSINAISGILNFAPDKLEVTGISKGGSIINLWVSEPSYSNANGSINFEGIIFNPGYKGSGGKVLTVTFKAKSSGTADLTFSSGSVLANDGQGTNVLNGFGSASFGIDVPTSGPAADKAETPAVVNGVPAAPQINSETHPNSDSWYNNNVATFSWELPSGITAAQLLVGAKPSAEPTVTYSPAISSRTLDALEDGVWYLHVRLKNANGWGAISHQRFQIDTKNPENVSLKLVEESDATNPVRKFQLEASDTLSGIDYYEIKIDGGEEIKWTDDGSHIFVTPVLDPGSHVIIVRVFDKAGNYASAFTEFFVDALGAPVITDYSRELQSKDIFVARGKARANSKVVVWLQRENDEPQSSTVSVDDTGNFIYIAGQRLSDGVYRLWAESIDERGAKSKSTDKYKVIVQAPRILRIGSLAVSVLSVIIPLIALVFLLIFSLFFSWRKWSVLRVRLRREVGEAETTLHKEFNVLRSRTRAHLAILEKISKKKKFTKEEKMAMEQLRSDLESAEHNVAKEIKDIRKQVN